MAVMYVVDVVAVLDREVPAARAVLVPVVLVGLACDGQCVDGVERHRRRAGAAPAASPPATVATKPASATSTIVAPGGRLAYADTTTPPSEASEPADHRPEHRDPEAPRELLRRRHRDDHQRAHQQQSHRPHRDATVTAASTETSML